MEDDSLTYHAEGLAREQLRETSLEYSPPRETSKLYADTLLGLNGLRSNHMALALDDYIKEELEPMILMVTNLKDGKPPSAQQVATAGDYFATCRERMSLWCVWSPAPKSTDTQKRKKNIKDQEKHGADAMTLHFKQAQQSRPKSFEDVVIFRRFRWLLFAQAKTVADGWIKELASSVRVCGAPVLEDGSVVGSAYAPGSATSSSCSAIVPSSSISCVGQALGTATEKKKGCRHQRTKKR